MPGDDERRAAFVRLQPICSRLLQDRSNASNVGQSLEALRSALDEVSDRGLRGCQEYVLFPLLLIVDSIAVSAVPAGTSLQHLSLKTHSHPRWYHSTQCLPPDPECEAKQQVTLRFM